MQLVLLWEMKCNMVDYEKTKKQRESGGLIFNFRLSDEDLKNMQKSDDVLKSIKKNTTPIKGFIGNFRISGDIYKTKKRSHNLLRFKNKNRKTVFKDE